MHVFWTDETLKLRIRVLESDLVNALRREASGKDWYRENWSNEADLRRVAEDRVKELEAEREVLLRAITGLGPTLLTALGKNSGLGEPR